MCGIAGFIDRQAAREQGVILLEAMLGRIQHRGPDERGLFTYPEVGCYFGMQRLSIIDLSTGQQPVFNEDGTVAVLFNGEIYNFVEIRSELICRGHVFRSESDTEVLVHSYEEYGIGMLSRLRGMFAFAIVDLHKRRCIFARDHFGQKPLYWHTSGGRMAFASELKALFALPWVPKHRDRDAFLDYISWFRLPAPRTHFRDVWKLGAGQVLEFDLDGPVSVQPRTYWTFGFNSDHQLRDMDSAAAELEQAIERSVARHLRSDVPVGLMLSGGLDSRVVGEFAKVHRPRGLKTFSVTYDGPDSEGSAARLSAEALGSEHFEVVVEPSDLLDAMEGVAWHMDEPVADPAAFAVWKLCRNAREHVKVLLGGEGADELFAGYGGRYDAIVSQARRTDFLRRFRMFFPRMGRRAHAGRFRRACYRAHLTTAAELVESRIEGFPFGAMAPWGLTTEQLSRLSTRSQQLARDLVRDHSDTLSNAQVLDVRWQLAESLLMKSDKMSMAASLELRCPFLDVDVAAVASRIAPELRLRSGIGKLVLRECLRRRLGVAPMLPKKGFPIPLDAWIRGPLRDAVEGALFSNSSEAATQLDPVLLKNAWKAFLAGEPLGGCFYALWLYEAWRKAFGLL